MTKRQPAYTWFLFAAALASAPAAADWPNLRGPNLDGRAAETAVFGAEFALETAWKHPLGTGYSSVSVAGGKAVTLFSDGEQDVAVAFDAATGEELWRRAFADTYRGHDGSSDGPVGTPTVDGGRVYFVGPRGGLYALDLAGGGPLWTRDLAEDFGAEAPLYGFSATPVVHRELLIVEAGGDAGRAVAALDKRTGELRWTAGGDPVTHSSPVLMEAGGERILLSSGPRRMTALRPADGSVLWSHEHSAEPPFDPTYPQILAFDRDKVLLTFQDEAVLYRLADGGRGVEEVWRSRGFKKSSAVPVAHGGFLYGFSGQFLTCLDAADGRVVWKSRPPGGRGLILVDGHLLVLGSEGWLTAVEATPEGYREKARIQVSEQGGYTAPSFADGRIYVRNLEDVAAVRVVAGRDGATGRREAASAAAGAFAAWVREVEAAPAARRSRMVDEFLAAQDGFPIVEGERRVHFVYRGPAEAVSIVGHMQADGAVPEPLARIAGTDLFYRSYELEAEGRWHYRFQVDFDDPAPDPLNPNRALGEREEVSELVMPGFRDPAHVEPLADPAGAGRLEDLELESEAFGRTVTVRVYLPAGYDDGTTDYPLLILPNGEQWLAAGLKNTLDHLFGASARPAVAAFVPIAGWVGGSWGGPARRLLADELLPRLDDAYRLDGSSGAAALWTVQEKAVLALDLIATLPERFGRAALQSPVTYRGELPSLDGAGEPRFYVSWSRYELRSAEQGYDEAGDARELRRRLAAAGFEVRGGEVAAGPGFRTWRQEAEDVLRFLLPRR